MPHDPFQFLRSLLAACESRGLYGPSHAGTVRALARASEELAGVLRERPAITLALAADGVLVDSLLVTETWATQSALATGLARAGVQAVRFLPGADQGDLAWLLDAVEHHRAGASPTGRVVFARVTLELQEGEGGAAGGPGEPRVRASALREAWKAAMSGEKISASAMAPLAANITSAVLDNRSALLHLIDLKAHNEYTFVHTTNVAILASALAQTVGLSADKVHQLTEAALLHDIGKWKIANSLLDKAGKLDDAERARMQQHPAFGAAILAGIPDVGDLSIVVAYEHHQRIDGAGYPKQARGRFPSLLSQIVQVADIFDALRSDRPYHAALPTDECLSILAGQAGKSFDRDLYLIFRDRIIRRVTDSLASRQGPGAPATPSPAASPGSAPNSGPPAARPDAAAPGAAA